MPFVPILMYHEVQEPTRPNPVAPPSWTVSIEQFQEHLDRLRAEGYVGISVSRWLAKRTDYPGRPVALTFDDGMQGNVEYAIPALREMGWTATFFIATGLMGQEGYATPEDWRDASNAGMDIASHGVTHTQIGGLGLEDALRELIQSRLALEKAIGIPVVGLSWPHGDVHREGHALLETSGYQWAATSQEALAWRQGDALSLPRLPVRSWHDADGINNLISTTLINRLKLAAGYRAKRLAKTMVGRKRYADLQSGLRGDSKPS